MNFDALFSDDATSREEALATIARAPEHERSALSSKLGSQVKEATAALANDDADAQVQSTRLARACTALARLRAPSAKSALFHVADEGTTTAKAVLARALGEAPTPEGRAVLVHLLSDDDARAEAVAAIASAPWREALEPLIEVAELDDEAAQLSARAIAELGAAGPPSDTNAAADFLLEQLDDDTLLPAAVDALLRFGLDFPGVAARAKRLAKEPGKRKVAGLCLVAASSDEGNAPFLELALSGSKIDEEAARRFLEPLRADVDERIRRAAERTWRALDLR